MRLPTSVFPFVRKMIANSVWFRGWTTSEVESLLRQCSLRRYEKSDLVYRDGVTDDLVLVLSGSVWICLRNDAKVTRFGIAYPSTLIGLSRLLSYAFHDEPRYEFFAYEETEALTIPASAMLSELEMRPDLWRSAAQAAILYQRHCVKLALVMYAGTIKDRLVSAIYQFACAAAMHASRLPQHELTIPQDDLAELIQSSRQHVNRALRALEEEGLVKTGYRRIIIVNSQEIERRALARFSDRSQADPEAGRLAGIVAPFPPAHLSGKIIR